MAVVVIDRRRAVEIGGPKILAADIVPPRHRKIGHVIHRVLIASGARQCAVDLLVGPPHIMPVLHTARLAGVGAEVANIRRYIDGLAVLRIVEGKLGPIDRLNCVPRVWRIDPSFTKIVEVRVEPLQINAGSGLEHVIDLGSKAVARAVVLVGAQVGRGKKWIVRAVECDDSPSGLQIIDPAPLPVVPATQENSPLLPDADAVTTGAINPVETGPADDVGVASLALEIECGTLAGSLGDEIDGAADGVPILAGG